MTEENQKALLNVLEGIREELEALRWTISSSPGIEVWRTSEERNIEREIEETTRKAKEAGMTYLQYITQESKD